MRAKEILHDMASSGGRPEDMTKKQIKEVRADFDSSLWLFAFTIFGFTDLKATLHLRMAELFEKWGEPGWKRLMLQVPRGSFKSSLCTIAGSTWLITKRPDEPVLIVNEKLDRASTWVRSIRTVAQNSSLFRTIYSDLLPPGIAQGSTSVPKGWKWSDTEIQFQRGNLSTPEASITAQGVGGASAGGHWPKIILDDLISEDAVNQPTTMERAKEWVDKARYIEKPSLGGNVFVACTRWATGDVYDYMLEQYAGTKSAFKLYKRSALEPNDAGQLESILPEVWSTEDLMQDWKTNEFDFSSQMMNAPKPSKQQGFEASWLRFGRVTSEENEEPFFVIEPQSYDMAITEVERSEPPRFVDLTSMQKIVLVDPAPSEKSQIKQEKHANNGVVVVGIDPWGRRYVLDCLATREDPLVVIRHCLRLLKRWKTHRLGVEEVAAQKYFRHWLLSEAAKDSMYVQVTPLKTLGRQKDTRITAMIPSMKSGFFYFNRDTTGKLIHELLSYPSPGVTRDLVDALAYCMDVLYRNESPEEERRRQIQDRQDWQGRDEVTGY